MVTFDYLLNLLYEIQGISDPSQPDASLKERMREIFDMACRAMRESGYHPDHDEETDEDS